MKFACIWQIKEKLKDRERGREREKERGRKEEREREEGGRKGRENRLVGSACPLHVHIP